VISVPAMARIEQATYAATRPWRAHFRAAKSFNRLACILSSFHKACARMNCAQISLLRCRLEIRLQRFQGRACRRKLGAP